MKRVYKKLVFGLLMLFAAAVIFASMTVPYNGLMWILKAILFWVLVQWGFVTVDKCNTEITKQMTDDEWSMTTDIYIMHLNTKIYEGYIYIIKDQNIPGCDFIWGEIPKDIHEAEKLLIEISHRYKNVTIYYDPWFNHDLIVSVKKEHNDIKIKTIHGIDSEILKIKFEEYLCDKYKE